MVDMASGEDNKLQWFVQMDMWVLKSLNGNVMHGKCMAR